jgi:lipopolysaccharide assembly outer membrane protein LptD (OstA)
MAVARNARPGSAHRRGRLTALVCTTAAALVVAAGFAGQAAAQFTENPSYVGIPAPRNVPTASSRLDTGMGGDAQMLVQADELQYDNTNNRILAVGNVRIY